MEIIMQSFRNWASINGYKLASVAVSAYFFYVFHSIVGLPPCKDLDATSTTYLVVSIFFFLLPLAKTLKLGKLLEFEAQVNEVKSEVKDFKDEIRQQLIVQNSLINTVTNTLNQNIHINLPGQNEIEEANRELDNTIEDAPSETDLESEIHQFLASQEADLSLALAKLRMNIERELRRILIKRLDTSDPTKMKGKFLSTRSLFNEFLTIYPKYKGMHHSFDYILKICNAAIHGQKISEGHAHEALQMGLKILKELENMDCWL